MSTYESQSSSNPSPSESQAPVDDTSNGFTQNFAGAKINTSGVSGGRIGSDNHGVRGQDYGMADITTGGGDVGGNNTASEVARLKEFETLLRRVVTGEN